MKRWMAGCVAGLLYCAAAPAQLVSEDELFLQSPGEQGCWVAFYAQPQFGGPSAELRGRSFVESFRTGPVVKPELKHVGGEAFLGRAGSVVVGPHARLMGYEDPRFRKPSLNLGPDRKVTDLSRIGYHDEVRSLKVFCEP